MSYCFASGFQGNEQSLTILGYCYYYFVVCSFAAHSSLDEYVAHWFGLNQSKYQWALDDYYESKGVVSFPSTQFLVFSVVFDVMI